jgi:uncharacterized phage protein gp47/JayE
MATIDDTTGLSISSYAETLTAYVVLWKNAIGENVRTGAQSVWGQVFNIFSLSVAEQNELAEFVAQKFNIQTATGAALSELVLLAGIQRQESASSTVTLTCSANAAGSTIPAGSLVKDPAGNIQWSTNAQVVVAPSSTNTVTATAVETGPFEAAAGTITQIDTPRYGWTAVTNLAAANVGQSEETDSALRLRYQTTVDGASKVSDGKRFAAVSDVSGVDAVIATSNNGTATDANGVPPQHVYTIVDGGTNAAVASAIYSQTAGGIGYFGTTTVSHQDPDSLQFYDVKFTRPSDVNIYVSVTVVPDDDFPTDGAEQIKAAIVSYINALGLGDDVYHSRLYTPVNSVPGHTVTALTLGFSASPTGTADLAIALAERAVTDTAKITVTS